MRIRVSSGLVIIISCVSRKFLARAELYQYMVLYHALVQHINTVLNIYYSRGKPFSGGTLWFGSVLYCRCAILFTGSTGTTWYYYLFAIYRLSVTVVFSFANAILLLLNNKRRLDSNKSITSVIFRKRTYRCCNSRYKKQLLDYLLKFIPGTKFFIKANYLCFFPQIMMPFIYTKSANCHTVCYYNVV